RCSAEHSTESAEYSAKTARSAGTSEHSAEPVEHALMVDGGSFDCLRPRGCGCVRGHAAHQHWNRGVDRLPRRRRVSPDCLAYLIDHSRGKLLLDYVLNT